MKVRKFAIYNLQSAICNLLIPLPFLKDRVERSQGKVKHPGLSKIPLDVEGPGIALPPEGAHTGPDPGRKGVRIQNSGASIDLP